MQTNPLLGEQILQCQGANTFIEIDYTDLQALGNGNTGTMAAVLNNVANATGTMAVYAQVVTPFTFSDAGIVSCQWTMGDAGNNARYLASMESAAVAAALTPMAIGALTQPHIDTVATAINLYATGTAGHNLNTCTGGVLRVFVAFLDTTKAII